MCIGRNVQLDCNVLCTGNVEAARWVLKRAADLKILTSDQITSLSAALADERSGSIQYGQILCMYKNVPFVYSILEVWYISSFSWYHL